MPINVVSQGPWRVGSLLWQPRPGALSLTVTCSSSFNLTPGESPLLSASAEPPLFEGDDRGLVEPWGPIAPWKRRAEVIVLGHAYAPGGAPVRELVPRVAVGGLDKVIQIRGDSWFMGDGSLTESAVFAHMPLRWERAAGGPGTRNPAGMPMGPEAVTDRWGRISVPNLLPFGTVIAAPTDVAEPAGFGPIRPEWPSRLERLHGYAASWDASRWMERPLPEDFDPAYFNVAPPDQTLDELDFNEQIVLEHLHPHHPRLATQVRSPAPQATARITGVEQSIPLRCDTLVIDTDRSRAVLVWRGQLAIDSSRRDVVVLVSGSTRAATSTSSSTLPASAVLPATELPFRRPRQVTPALSADAASEVLAPALHFFSRTPSGDVTETLSPALQAHHPSLPFRASSPPPMDDEPDEGVPTPRRMTPVSEPPPSSENTAPAFATPAWFHDAPSTSPPAAYLPEWTPRPAEEPPPLLGSLAYAALSAPKADEALALPEPTPVAAPPSEAPEPTSLPLDDFPLARTAALAAKLDRRPDDRTMILEQESLGSDVWDALDEHWRRVVDADLARGKKTLLGAYDEAYVGSLEAERGPIIAVEHARLLIAAERGTTRQLLAELGLPAASTMRIRRVWLGRTVRDPRAADALRLAMRAASEG